VPYRASLTSLSTIWADVEYEGVHGVGHVDPVLRVLVGMEAPSDRVGVEAHRLIATLSFLNERLSRTELTPTEIHSRSTTAVLEFPISARALSFVADHARDGDVSLKLELSGLLRIRRLSEADGLIRSDVPVGEWAFAFINPVDFTFTVARSDWYSKVVAPITDKRYVAVEIEVDGDQSRLRESFRRVAEAEAAYATGDDSGVFAKCRAAIEALPGFPASITATIGNDRKRAATDELLKEASAYLHTGRHVSKQPEDAAFTSGRDSP
jgi:hypothetical protein